jgi:uroporphyrinogen-III decarboxylase
VRRGAILPAIVTNRERVMAALKGEPVDRVPLAFWMHNFGEGVPKELGPDMLAR